jgi:hypothetical protein
VQVVVAIFRGRILLIAEPEITNMVMSTYFNVNLIMVFLKKLCIPGLVLNLPLLPNIAVISAPNLLPSIYVRSQNEFNSFWGSIKLLFEPFKLLFNLISLVSRIIL